MLRLTRKGIGVLSKQYLSVLKKCFLINLGVFSVGIAFSPTNVSAQEVAALNSTLDKINTQSVAYLNGDHSRYELYTTQGSRTHRIIINNTTYWYTPSEGDTAVVNLAGIGGAALTESTTEPSNYVFRLKTGDTYTYYSYDTSKLAESGIKITEGTLEEHDVAQTQADGTVKYYKINHVTPTGYTQGDRTVTPSASERNYYTGNDVAIKDQGGAITVSSTTSSVTADISENRNTGAYPAPGGILHSGDGDIGSVAADFYKNVAASDGAGLRNNDKSINYVIGDFVGNVVSAGDGGALSVRKGTVRNIQGNFINNSVITAGKSGGAVQIREGVINSISGNFVHNIASLNGGAINDDASKGSKVTSITGDFTDNVATSGSGGAIYTGKEISSINGSFIANQAGNRGGAIYAINAPITIETGANNDILFSANRDSTGYNDIHSNGGTVNLKASEGRTITFNGSVTGENNSTLTATGGNYVFNNTISTQNISLTNVDSFKLGTKTQADSTTTKGQISADTLSFSGDKNNLDTRNTIIDAINATNITLDSAVAMAIDANLQNNTSDTIHATTIDGTGSFIIDAINVLVDKDTDTVLLTLTDDASQYDKYSISNKLLQNIEGTDNIFRKATYANGVLTLENGLTLEYLDEKMGNWNDGNYIVSYDNTDETTIAKTSLGANVQALDAAVGKVESDGYYIKAFNKDDVQNTSIAANLETLDEAIHEVDSKREEYVYDQFAIQVPGVKAIKIDKAGIDSKEYLENNKGTHYTLSEDEEQGVVSITIAEKAGDKYINKTYYYNPTDSDIARLVDDGYVTLKEVSPAEVAGGAQYVFTNGTKYWTLDDTKHSGTKVVEGNENDYNYSEVLPDGRTKYYKVIHVVPKGYTVASERIDNLKENIDEMAFYDLKSEKDSQGVAGGGAISIKNNIIDHITADFKGNTTTGTRDSAGALYVSNNSVLNNLTGSFEANIGNYGGVVQNKGTIGNILGDFVNNEDEAGGAAIDNNGTIRMIYGDFLGNFDKTPENKGGNDKYNGGGAIRNTARLYGSPAVLLPAEIGTIKGSFINNYAKGKYGGAINNQGTIGEISADFTGNSAHLSGGAIINMAYHADDYESAGKIGVITGNFLENIAGEHGGAIYNEGASKDSSLTINSSVIDTIFADFTGNVAEKSGGAIYSGEHGKIGDIFSDFENNQAREGDGGAIYYVGNGKTDEDNNAIGYVSGKFIKNTTLGSGGAIYLDKGKIENFTSDIFTGNIAGNLGGAIMLANTNESKSLENGSVVNELSGEFVGNMANSGGAIYNQYGTLSRVLSSFSDNNAFDKGGAVYNENGLINIVAEYNNISFYNNTGYDDEGNAEYNDIYNDSGTINVNAAEGKQISFGGTIRGSEDVEHNILGINTQKDATSDKPIGGTYIFNNVIEKNKVNWHNSAHIKFGSQLQEDGSTTYGYVNNVGLVEITQAPYLFRSYDTEGGYYNYWTFDTINSTSDVLDYLEAHPDTTYEMIDITDMKSGITIDSIKYKFKSAISDSTMSDLIANSTLADGANGDYVFKYGTSSWSIGSADNDSAIKEYLNTISSTYELRTTGGEGKVAVQIGGTTYYYEPDSEPGAAPITDLIKGGAIIKEVSQQDVQDGKIKAVFANESYTKYWTIEALNNYQYDLTKVTDTENFNINSRTYIYTPADEDIAALTRDTAGTKYSGVQTAILDTQNNHLENNTMKNLYLLGDVKLRVDVDLGNSNNINPDGLALGVGSDTFKTLYRNNIFGPNDDKMMVIDSINLLSASRKDAIAVQITNEFNHHVAVSPNILENITGADNLHSKVEYRDETGELVVHDRFAVISDLADALNTLVEGTVATYHGLYEQDKDGNYVYMTWEEGQEKGYTEDKGFEEDSEGYILDPLHHERIKKFDPLVGTITYSSNDESVTEADASEHGIFHVDAEGNYDNDYRFVKGRAVRLLDATLVHKTGEENITGVKTFESATTGSGDEATKYTTALDGSSIVMSEVVGTETPTTTQMIKLDGVDGSADFAGDVTIGGTLGVTGLTTLNGLNAGATNVSSLSIGSAEGRPIISSIEKSITSSSDDTQVVTALGTKTYVDTAVNNVISDVTAGVTEMYNHAHNWAEYVLGVDVDENREEQLQHALGTTNYLGNETNFVGAFKKLDSQVKINANDIDTLEDTKYDKSGGAISGDVTIGGITKLNATNGMQFGEDSEHNVTSITHEIDSTESEAATAARKKQLVTAEAVYEYVDENGGKIQKITVGGTEKQIEDKTVALGAAADAGLIKTSDTSASSDDSVYTSAKTDALLGNKYDKSGGAISGDVTIGGTLGVIGLTTLNGLNAGATNVSSLSVLNAADFNGLATFSTTKGMRFGSGQVVKNIVNVIDVDASDSVLKEQLVTAKAVKAYVSSVDENLEQLITNEAQARADADTALGGRIDTEAQARADADTALSGRINNAETAIATEKSAREAADTALGGRIDTEAQARADADTALGGRIDNAETAIATEKSARETADTALGGRIDTEAQARADADTALGGRIDNAETAIATEKSAREAADTALGGRIDTEAQARADADTALGGRIDTEAQARADADTALGGRIDNAETAIATEKSAREAADTALGGRIDTEAQARADADTALGGRIDNAETAIATEKSAREAADTALGGRIDTEAQARADADTALGGRIDSAVTDISANTADIATLKGSVTTEGSVLKSIKDSAANGTYSSSVDYADNTIGAAIKDLEEGGGDQGKKIKALQEALGGEFDADTGEWSANLKIATGPGAVNYGNYTVKKIEVALEKIMSNVGSAADLGDEYNDISTTNTVNKNIASLNSTIGNFEDLNDSTNFTNGRPTDEGYNVPENVVGVLNNIDKTLGTVHGLTDKLRDLDKYNGNLSDKGTVETHLTAVDVAIGDRSQMNNISFTGYNNIAGMNVADALTSVASSVGTAADLGYEYNGVSSANTVNSNIAAVNLAIGDISTLRNTVYASGAENISDAIIALDNNMYRLDNQVNELNDKYHRLSRNFRRGMASMAAMSAMAPNARANGNTQLTVGTGAYDNNTAAAIGLFHWINNNVMINMGAAWGNSSNAIYRMGLTYAW